MREEISLGDLQQRSYLVGMTRDMIGSIGKDWREIGGNGREQDPGDKEDREY